MKLKKMLCAVALSAAVALVGVPVSGAVLTVQAEEAQVPSLDDILRQMYALYVNGDYASMYAVDVNDITKAYVEAIGNSGSDRYVIDLDGDTKAMLYVSDNGGWWWYFGQMENNLRQGNGMTIICGSGSAEIFTGIYNADFPGGEGRLTQLFSSGSVFDFAGYFQGAYLNGVYQVNVNWSEDGILYSSSLSSSYVNNHLQSVDGWGMDIGEDESDPVTWWEFWTPTSDSVYFSCEEGYEVFAVGLYEGEEGWSTGWMWYMSSEILQKGESIFKGNATASVYIPVPEVTIPEQTVPEEQETPVPEVTESTPEAEQPTIVQGAYIVECDDNLSKIAQKVYGNRKLWRRIYEANKDVIKNDSYIIYVNQVLVIPEL